MVALTSGWSLTRTWCEPTVLIGSRTSIRRRSSSGPPARRPAVSGPPPLAPGCRDVGGADGTEQPAVAARPPPHPHLQPLKLGCHRLGVLDAADLPGRPG